MEKCPLCGWLHFGQHDCPFAPPKPYAEEPRREPVFWGRTRRPRRERVDLRSPDWMPK